jgi:tetratricopeptide (TPR) repeat protein
MMSSDSWSGCALGFAPERMRVRVGQGNSMRSVLAVLLLAVVGGVRATGAADVAQRYHEAWYLENGLLDVARAAEVYREVATSPQAEPALAARALLRLAACYRFLGQEAKASEAELSAQRQFPEEIQRFPIYRLGVLHKQLDEAFGVGATPAEGQAVERFLEGLDVATVHSICEACYQQAADLRAREPLASVPVLRKAIAISTYLRQTERSAFAQKDIGDIYAAAGRTQEAIAAYRAVQESFPTCRGVAAWAGMSIAELHRLEGRLAEAVEAYRAVEHDYAGQLPQGLWALLWMGDAFRAAGKMADAQAAWRRVLEDFNDPAYADVIALAARLLGQGTQELPRLPDDEFANDAAYFLAVQCEMAGDREQAAKWYERCLALSKGNDWPRALAARALEGRL